MECKTVCFTIWLSNQCTSRHAWKSAEGWIVLPHRIAGAYTLLRQMRKGQLTGAPNPHIQWRDQRGDWTVGEQVQWFPQCNPKLEVGLYQRSIFKKIKNNNSKNLKLIKSTCKRNSTLRQHNLKYVYLLFAFYNRSRNHGFVDSGPSLTWYRIRMAISLHITVGLR